MLLVNVPFKSTTLTTPRQLHHTNQPTTPHPPQLFKNVAERGRWSEMLMKAHWLFSHDHIDQSYLTYQLLAEMGYEAAQSNVAYILDQGYMNLKFF